MSEYTLHLGDCLDILPTLPECRVQCVVTSPPYFGLRDYGIDGQIGLEQSPAEYVAKMVAVFGKLRRVLRDDGVVWLNLGDSYNGSGKGSVCSDKTQIQRSNMASIALPTFVEGLAGKQLIGIPWRVAFALQDDGWYLRSDIIWHKPNPMPESVKDRPTRAHEYIFLLTKNARYYYNAEAIAEPTMTLPMARDKFGEGYQADYAGGDRFSAGERVWGASTRNVRSVWSIATQPRPEAHFAAFPDELARRCILAGSKPGDTILDPFAGRGTTLAMAIQNGRQVVGIELNPEYGELIRTNVERTQPPLLVGDY